MSVFVFWKCDGRNWVYRLGEIRVRRRKVKANELAEIFSLISSDISSLSFMIKTFLQLENCGLREYVSDGTKESFCSEKVGSERRHQSMLMASPGLFSISRFPAMMKKIHVKAFQLVKKNFLEAFKENMGVIVLDKRECEKWKTKIVELYWPFSDTMKPSGIHKHSDFRIDFFSSIFKVSNKIMIEQHKPMFLKKLINENQEKSILGAFSAFSGLSNF